MLNNGDFYTLVQLCIKDKENAAYLFKKPYLNNVCHYLTKVFGR